MTPEQIEGYMRGIRRVVREQERAVQYVESEDESAQLSFAYTVGNHLAGRAELIVFGPRPMDAALLLNAISAALPHDGSVPSELPHDGSVPSELLLDGARLPARLYAAPLAYEFTAVLQRFVNFGASPPIAQLLLSDKTGRFPPDPETAQPYRRQPMLWTSA